MKFWIVGGARVMYLQTELSLFNHNAAIEHMH